MTKQTRIYIGIFFLGIFFMLALGQILHWRVDESNLHTIVGTYPEMTKQLKEATDGMKSANSNHDSLKTTMDELAKKVDEVEKQTGKLWRGER